jgi:uncharacterized protein YPO0396
MELRFDFATDDSLTGFRLSTFEFYNWGTYNNFIYSLDLKQKNALLTGDIGSGKSTIVDALTTLLVPHQKIIYNKAAGASSKERTLRSYILGEYKSSKDDNYTTSKAVALRDESSFTVLLARFENDGFDESVTIAQFFHIVNSKEQKFFIVSQGKLGIKENFFNFKDAKELKKRLRNLEHTTVYDSFSEYSKNFSRLMGIKNEQALNLFYQSVSLKEIGNLTSFIQTHMLEKGDIDKKIEELCRNFGDLNHAHNSVLRAKRQIELLLPVDSHGKKYENDLALKEENESIRESLAVYFAKIERELLSARIGELEIELTKSHSNKTTVENELDFLRDKEVKLKIELENNGGNRLSEIEQEIKSFSQSMQERKKQNEDYNTLAKLLELPIVSNEHRFLNNINDAKDKIELVEADRDRREDEKVFNASAKQRLEENSKELEIEILYLQNNRSNIPHKISKLRNDMAESLGLAVEELPFVGELIKVTDKKWEGAIERVLHSFALSLLVKNEHYDEVVSYVEKTNLRGKLVYLKMTQDVTQKNFSDVALHSLLGKIELKADSPLFEKLKNMLNERFNIPCIDTLSEFKKLKKALTINGQFKTNLSRHEKDDRFALNDKSRWVLGWDNLSKLETLQEEHKRYVEKIELLHVKIGALKEEESELRKRRDHLRDILKYRDFSQIDWYSVSKKIDELCGEKEELEKSSDIIRSLQEQIASVSRKMKDESAKLEDFSKKTGAIEEKIINNKAKKEELEELLQSSDTLEKIHDTIEKLFLELIAEKTNLNNVKMQQANLRAMTQKKIDTLSKALEKSSGNVIKCMGEFSSEFQTVAKDFDVSLASLGEYREKLRELKRDDLPRWEKKFGELFKEGTIRNILMIQEELGQQSNTIKKKIESINNSLKDIEYNDGTYIELIAESGVDVDIREFKQSLKNSTTLSIDEDNNYDEVKFTEIKKIIDRFNGREGFVDIDKSWTKKVTDVRNWFNFSAMERYLSDGSEREYYAHSGGKSGGQKEKLAYTVLASSLAYQFGVEYDKIQSRSFRFVMIDEAFGRGSDESTKYALRLFEKLKLQLLVITPKQKINIIEPFVQSVHFVHNQDGVKSTLLSMSIEEYKENKSKA